MSGITNTHVYLLRAVGNHILKYKLFNTKPTTHKSKSQNKPKLLRSLTIIATVKIIRRIIKRHWRGKPKKWRCYGVVIAKLQKNNNNNNRCIAHCLIYEHTMSGNSKRHSISKDVFYSSTHWNSCLVVHTNDDQIDGWNR